MSEAPVFCPACGQRTIEKTGGAFVEEGAPHGSGYELEGEADKYCCTSCSYAFLEWSNEYEEWGFLVAALQAAYQVGDVVHLRPHPYVEGWSAFLEATIVEWRDFDSREDEAWVLALRPQAHSERSLIYLNPRQLAETYWIEKSNTVQTKKESEQT